MVVTKKERKKEYEKWHFGYRTLLHLAVFRVAFGHLYESCQELMSGEAAKERVTTAYKRSECCASMDECQQAKVEPCQNICNADRHKAKSACSEGQNGC